ncbi:hypothetical protein OF83DRAFT_1045951, partial [Amylostereum chailletii]
GEPLNPPIARHIKSTRGFNHPRTGFLLCPAGLNWEDEEIQRQLRDGETIPSGDQWPICLYEGYHYDPEDAWKGLLRSSILVMAFKYIFTSPSSV